MIRKEPANSGLTLSRLFRLAVLGTILTRLDALPFQEDASVCGYEDARFLTFMLPVLPADPLEMGSKTEIVCDLVISPEGDLAAKAATYAPSREFIQPVYRAIDQSRFTPALECDEPASGFIRHTIADYFFLSKTDPEGTLVLPTPLWTLDRYIIGRLDSICKLSPQESEVLIEFEIGADGRIKRFNGRTRLAKALIKHFFTPMREQLFFQPATRSDEPVKCKLTLRLAPDLRSAYSSGNRPPVSKLAPLPRNPDLGQDAEVLATIDFDSKGEISAARVTGDTPPALATAVMAAVRQWRYVVAGSSDGPTRSSVTCLFGFVAGEEEAVLLDQPKDVILELPLPIKRVAPTFPHSQKMAGYSGRTEAVFIVDAHGDVQNIDVISTTHNDFSQSTETALRQWKFKPGSRNGEPVAFRMMIPMAFNLNP